MGTLPSKKFLVIGLGNPLSGDDGFGPRVLDLLTRELPRILDRCRLIAAGTDLLNQFEEFSRHKRIVLVDAVLDPLQKIAPTGRVITLGHSFLESLPDLSPGAHSISPLLAVKLYHRMHPCSSARFSLVALCTDRIEIGDPSHLSDTAVESGRQAVLALVDPEPAR